MGWLVRVEAERCSLCGLCATACRERALEMREEEPAGLAFIPERCNGCLECQRICPEKAVALFPSDAPIPVFSSRLLRCRLCGRPTGYEATLRQLCRRGAPAGTLELCPTCKARDGALSFLKTWLGGEFDASAVRELSF